MFKNLTTCALLILLLFVPAFSQGEQETKKSLTEKALTLYRQGKFEKAIEAAERVVELEKTAQPPDALSYANALINAARMKQGYIVELQEKSGGKDLFVRDRIELSDKISRIAAETETLLRAALQSNENNGRAQTAQTADIKSELAALVQKYNPAAKPSIDASRARIDEAEKFLAESVSLNEQARGKDADQTLAVVLQTGDFYLRYVNFEKASPFYERYVETAERKGVQNYPELANALRSYASILFATFQEKETAEAVKKLEDLTRRKEAEFKDYNLQARSKDAVAFSSQIYQTFGTESGDFRQRLKLQGRTMTRSDYEMSPRVTRVQVKVVVDENGKVVEAVAGEETKDEKLRARAEQTISKWFVRPFADDGTKRRMRGVLTYQEMKK